MIEEEAKAKWCPMAREIDKSSNGLVSHNHNTQCIASDCMMWQWNKVSQGALDNLEYLPSTGDFGGYCGLVK